MLSGKLTSVLPSSSSSPPSRRLPEDGSVEYDRTGLPLIPKGSPPKGDTIDLAQIQEEFRKRPSPTPASVPLRNISHSSQQQQQNDQPHHRLEEEEEEEEEEEFDEFYYNPPERRSTRPKLPKRTAFTAGFLLFVGVLFSTLGLSFLFTMGFHQALPFLIIGGIGFIPGSYVSFIIYQTWKGVPGYSYDMIPSYDD